ncbi:MAG: hypothetical protein AMJ88_05660 [Anaerolineae bacterium SM23_ 63]|nr:MAG: hypothetical protein AMJ88_05660 [Anaerolineae bacterium SM23_ 63]
MPLLSTRSQNKPLPLYSLRYQKWESISRFEGEPLRLELEPKVLCAQRLALLRDFKSIYSDSWDIGNMVRFSLALQDDRKQERDHRYVHV